MKVLRFPKDVYSLTYVSIFTKITMRSKMRNDPHIFLPLLIVKMFLKPQGCLNLMFEEENLILSQDKNNILCVYG